MYVMYWSAETPKFHFSIFPLFSFNWDDIPTNCSLLGTDKTWEQISKHIFEKHMTDRRWDPEQKLPKHHTLDSSKRKESRVPSRDKLFSINIIFISFYSHLDRTAAQLSAHTDVAVPCQRMNSDITRMGWREDLMNNNGVPIKVAPKNLKLKMKLNIT